VDGDPHIIKEVTPLVDLFEVRIDLIGDGWEKLAGQLAKPWIACNRIVKEGGRWRGTEEARIAALFRALDLGAAIVDIELATPDINKVVSAIKGRAKCLISYHDLKRTSTVDRLRSIIRRELDAGADIGKVVTTARDFADNLRILQLIPEFPLSKIVAFAMGEAGAISRVFCPLVGGAFTYAAAKKGREAAPAQLTVGELRNIYRMLKNGD
jgi:3-dehydroquinate dehydratase type I